MKYFVFAMLAIGAVGEIAVAQDRWSHSTTNPQLVNVTVSYIDPITNKRAQIHGHMQSIEATRANGAETIVVSLSK